MHKLFAFLSIFLFAGPALAAITSNSISSEFAKLSPTKRAEIATLIALEAEKASSSLSKIPTVEPDDVEPWLKLIDHMGAGLMKLAHDLGVEVNTLLTSPIGLIAVGLIAYHVMGDLLVGIFTGLLWFALITPLLILYFYKVVIPVTGHVEVTQKRMFGDPVQVQVPVRRKVSFEDKDGNGPEWTFFSLLVAHCFVTMIFIA